MDTVTLLTTALSVRNLRSTVSEAADAAYKRVRERVAQRFAGVPARELILTEFEKSPDVWQVPLSAALAESGAATDPELIDSAQRLMHLLEESEPGARKYNIELRGGQGVQIGDRNTQTNNFSAPPDPHP